MFSSPLWWAAQQLHLPGHLFSDFCQAKQISRDWDHPGWFQLLFLTPFSKIKTNFLQAVHPGFGLRKLIQTPPHLPQPLAPLPSFCCASTAFTHEINWIWWLIPWDYSNRHCHQKRVCQPMGTGITLILGAVSPLLKQKTQLPCYKQHEMVKFYFMDWTLYLTTVKVILKRILDGTNPKGGTTGDLCTEFFFLLEVTFSFLCIRFLIIKSLCTTSFSGTDEKKIIEVLSSRTSEQRQQIKQKYKALYNKVFFNKWPLCLKPLPLKIQPTGLCFWKYQGHSGFKEDTSYLLIQQFILSPKILIIFLILGLRVFLKSALTRSEHFNQSWES